jgi:transcriptional regulator with GAF, ATPase, and Fis domain
VFTRGAAAARVMALVGGELELGRRDGSPGQIDDGRISRQHARIELTDGRWIVTDLGSQNGTFADGRRAAPRTPVAVERVLRVGDTLLVPYADVRPFQRAGVRDIGGFVRGPAMQAIVAEAEQAGRAGTTLHVRGESGSGKEGVVQAFHRATGRAQDPVSVNCAAIPHGLAERLLFGVKRGTYSGAEADAAGYLQEADGGTLFLDEIAELELQVQAKLLRVLESRELLPLGASKSRKVDFALCSATNKDLRALVSAGALREDLYFRIATPSVVLPPLRDRPEEIPALIAQALGKRSPAPHVSFIEQCLLRAWPGNVRELLAAVQVAAQAALAGGDRILAEHLAATAGSPFGAAPGAAAAPASGGEPAADAPRKRISRDDAGWRQRIDDALRASDGNRAVAARALGLHRTQLYRLMKRLQIPLDGATSPPDECDDDDGDDDGDDSEDDSNDHADED